MPVGAKQLEYSPRKRGIAECFGNMTTKGEQMTTAEDIKKYVADVVKDHDLDSRPIYAIMLFEHPAKELVYEENGVHSGFPDLGRTDEPGFYYDVDTAVRAMHENACDIRETVYSAGFVLVKFPGMYSPAGPKERIYFLWDDERKGFFEAEEPALFAHVSY